MYIDRRYIEDKRYCGTSSSTAVTNSNFLSNILDTAVMYRKTTIDADDKQSLHKTQYGSGTKNFAHSRSRSLINVFWCYYFKLLSEYCYFSSSLIIILLFYIAGNYPVSALRRYEYSNVDADGQYRCYQEVLNNAPLMKLSRQTIFDQPCKCRVDWKLAFCNDLNYFMQQKHNEDINLPEVCICRQFLDAYSNCYQFITRCFKKSSNQCSCCFNQAEEHCNQLPCSNGEPLFEATSNTTCICYSPSAYPYHLCLNVKLSPTWLNVASEELDNQNSVRRQQKLLTEGDKMVNNDSVLISGIRITPKNACIILFSLIGVCILMTSVWITIRYLRLKREHTERSNRLQQAQAELLRRRDSEERYLP